MLVALCAVCALAKVPSFASNWRSGNLISRKDAEGAETEYIYDRMNRIDRIEYPDNSVVGFAYDQAGKVLTATNADSTLGFGYDPMNRVSAVTSSVAVVNCSHDKNGNRTGLTLPG